MCSLGFNPCSDYRSKMLLQFRLPNQLMWVRGMNVQFGCFIVLYKHPNNCSTRFCFIMKDFFS
uniref:Uncharacterized protein n=1 Tax=Arundo donax TaxID=35708 RepID=A0A0A9ABC4_ARUDO